MRSFCRFFTWANDTETVQEEHQVVGRNDSVGDSGLCGCKEPVKGDSLSAALCLLLLSCTMGLGTPRVQASDYLQFSPSHQV